MKKRGKQGRSCRLRDAFDAGGKVSRFRSNIEHKPVFLARKQVKKVSKVFAAIGDVGKMAVRIRKHD